MFSPTLGRWTQNDPIEFEAGDPNLYRFVENSPVTHMDPSGLGLHDGDGAKGTIDAIVDTLHWPADKKEKIKEQLRKLIDIAQFQWYRRRGAFGKCHQWVDEIYPKVKEMLPILLADGISVHRREWRVNDFFGIGGHAAVIIYVNDAPGSQPDNTFKFYLDDGYLGKEDHVFVDAEVPAKWRRSAGYSWMGGDEKLEDCGCEPPIGPGSPLIPRPSTSPYPTPPPWKFPINGVAPYGR